MIARRIIGLLIVLVAIAGGAICTSVAGLIVASYWDPNLLGDIRNRVPLFGAAIIGVLASYGLYRLGRFIVR
jgi:hypothetical protein